MSTIFSPNDRLAGADGISTPRTKIWVDGVTDLQILTGEGSPEGAEEGVQGKLYMDTIGTAGSILYVKRDADISGDRTQGWILV